MVEARLAQGRLQRTGHRRHLGAEEGVDRGGQHPRVLADPRQHVRGRRHVEVGRLLGDDLGQPALVLGMLGAPEKADRDRFDSLLVEQLADRAAGGVLVERADDAALVVDALANLADIDRVDDRVLLLQASPVFEGRLVEAEALHPAHRHRRVAEALGDQHAGLRPAALEQAVGGDRGAVGEEADAADELGPIEAGVGGGEVEGGEHPVDQVAGGGRGLVAADLAGVVEHDGVGEGAADIGGDEVLRGIAHVLNLSSRSSAAPTAVQLYEPLSNLTIQP